MAKQSKAGASYGACRFCGQSVIVEDGAEMTALQLEEAATMLCGCDEAIKYQQEKNRRTVAKQRINELFGEDAGEYKQPETVREIMLNAVDAICDKKNESRNGNDQNGASLPDHANGKGQNKGRAGNQRQQRICAVGGIWQ